INDLLLVNATPFEGDTLVKAKKVSLTMPITELFGDDAVEIHSFSLEGAKLNLKENTEDQTNYDISKSEDYSDSASSNEAAVFDIRSYRISDSELIYEDLDTGLSFTLSNINHEGEGTFSLEESLLNTQTQTDISLRIAGVTWFNEIPVNLKAIIGIDLENNTYTFKDNSGFLRDLPIELSGSVKVLKEAQQWAMSIRALNSDFENFLALIPEDYRGYAEGITTRGTFELEGTLQGNWDDTYIPKLDFQLLAKDGYLKYPDLAKALENIQFEIGLKNTTGLPEDTFLAINNALFSIGSDRVSFSSVLSQLTGNMNVKGTLKANLDLQNLKEAYPLESLNSVDGKVQVDVTSSFSMNDIETGAYENTRSSGDIKLNGIRYKQENAPDTFIENAAFTFTSEAVIVDRMSGTTGNSDFSLKGTVANMLGYTLRDEPLKGNFSLRSKRLDLNDFMGDDEDPQAEETQPDGEHWQIPDYLNAVFTADISEVIYDDIVLSDITGALRIRDGSANFSDVSSKFLGGNLLADGKLVSKGKPTFDIQLALQNNSISELLNTTTFFEKLAPIARGLQGTMDSKFRMQGSFVNGFELDFNSLSGQAQTELKALDKILGEQSFISGLRQKLDFLNEESLDLKGLKTVLKFQDGNISVSPFTFNYKDIKIDVSGSHTFTGDMNYAMQLEVPAYYLGSEVNALIASLGDPELKEIPVPVNVSISGTYTSPNFNTDLKSSVTTLTGKLIEIQKARLKAKGTEKVKDLLGGIFTSGQQDSTTRDTVTEPSVKGVLGDILSKGSKPADSTITASDSSAQKPQSIEKTATDIIGGIFKKKKQDTTAKDTVNQ
ncbi:MAG: AsmA-like C-terminal region-containing protein, partial [Bacteroidia bacterium]|nr:AsmA-like C-terminal region-containing protein [Bacteroidia bacterium]